MRRTLAFSLALGLLSQLIGCSKQPHGAVSSCTGTTSIQEDVANSLNATYQYLPNVGQYVRFSQNMTVREIMLLTYSTAATSITIQIYRNSISDPLDSNTTALKTYSLTGPFTTNDLGELWMALPEPFDFVANTEEDDLAGRYYFIAVEASGGIFGLYGGPRDSGSRLRQGIRAYGSPWGTTDTSLGYAMGFRGLDGCQGF